MGVTSNPKRKSYSALLPLRLLGKETMRGERQSLVVMAASEGWIGGVKMQLAPERLDALLSLLCLESRKRSDMRTDPPHATVVRTKGKSVELGRGEEKGQKNLTFHVGISGAGHHQQAWRKPGSQ